MPFAPPKACKVCGALSGDYYCPEHKPKKDANRLNSSQRGYDSDWKKFRKWFLMRHPICEDCHIKPATDGHHILKLRDYPHLRLVESNVMALCSDCHDIRSANGE